MKNKNLVLGIVLIAIVLIISLVAYSNKNKKEMAENSALMQAQEQENLASNGNPNEKTNTTVKGISDLECASPTLKITSPNGGESYKVNQTVVFKWKSCNISKNAHIVGTMVGVSDVNNSVHLFGQTDDQLVPEDTKSANDGQITVNLGNNTATGIQKLNPGTYKFKISVLDQPGIFDESDAYFTLK